MQDPIETHALIFRGIESIRVYFADINQLNSDSNIGRKVSWEMVHTKLNYKRDDFKFIEDGATARRHGEMKIYTEKEYVECLVFGWKFIVKFIESTFESECRVPTNEMK